MRIGIPRESRPGETLVAATAKTASQLAALGYATPENALGHLRALVGGGARRGQIQAVLLPTLLEWLADTPDPDAGLLNYRRLSEATVDQTWFLRTLRDEGAVAHPPPLVVCNRQALIRLSELAQTATAPPGPHARSKPRR